MKNQEVKPYNGTPKEWARTFEIMIGNVSLEELNAANHLALEKKQISLEHFFAAAEVLKKEILKR